jgi:hypothetical protein
MQSRSEEYVTTGYRGAPVLRVPVERSIDKAPAREGWEPFFVNVNLDHPVQKVVSYKRKES